MFDPIWVTKDGRQMHISQMTTSHVEACVAKIERSRTGWRVEYLERLRLELDIRRLNLRTS